jgi:hypothetical protein
VVLQSLSFWRHQLSHTPLPPAHVPWMVRNKGNSKRLASMHFQLAIDQFSLLSLERDVRAVQVHHKVVGHRERSANSDKRSKRGSCTVNKNAANKAKSWLQTIATSHTGPLEEHSDLLAAAVPFAHKQRRRCWLGRTGWAVDTGSPLLLLCNNRQRSKKKAKKRRQPVGVLFITAYPAGRA